MPENLQLEITVIAPAYVWVTVLGDMQLALRHPDASSGPAAEIARDFGDHLLAKLIAEGVFTAEEGVEVWPLIARKKPSGPTPETTM